MKKRSLAALLLVLAMLLSLMAGCGSSSSETSSEASESTSESSEEETTEEAEEAEESEEAEASEEAEESSDAEEAEAEESEEAGPAESTEVTHLTMLFQFASFFQSFFPEGWNASDWWTEFGEATNTEWELQEVSNMAWTENVTLLCASDSLPDVVTNFSTAYNGGIAAAIRDEQIIDFADMVEEYAPNYLAKLSADDYTLKTAITDDGEMGAMYPLVEEPYPVTSGLWIRQDWLDELGMDIPTDTDSLYDVLVAFRDEYGASNGFYQQIRANTNLASVAAEGIWNAFGPTDYFLDEDGVVQYGPMQDYFYEYLAYLQKLANEGLFLTSDMTDSSSSELFASGSIGLEGDSPDNLNSYIVLLSEEEQAKINLVPMAAIGEPTEYSPKTTYISTDAGGNISISANCETPEVVLQAFDYLFTDEGAILSSYGVEGEGYELDENGDPQLTDLILSNPDGIPTRAALGYYLNPGVPGLIDYARSHTNWTDTQNSSYEIWNSAYTGDSQTIDVDALSLTEDEQDDISNYRSDMITYAQEWINGVIFNNEPIDDAAIEEFRTTMEETMHINDILEIYNNAYQRFQARSLD